MQEIVKIPDDVFEKETANTIFEDYYVYLAMSIFCRFDNRTYTDNALLRELHGIIPEIKKQDLPSILNPLLNKDYIGIKDRRYYFPKQDGIKVFNEIHLRLLEKSEYPKKSLKPRKSFFQELHETTPNISLYC